MDAFGAFARGEANRGNELMVFDWDKAATMIKEMNAKNASAGLASDWYWTGGSIFKDGEPVMDDYTYLASTWAIPELEVDGEAYNCYKMEGETPGWGADTKWPESSLNILNE